MYEEGRLGYFVCGTGILVNMLLERGAEGDLVKAQDVTDRLAALPTDEVWTIRDVWLLRLRALLARARGDDAAYRDFAGRYREKATSLGFEGHIAWADTMTTEDNESALRNSSGPPAPELSSLGGLRVIRLHPPPPCLLAST